MKLVICDDNISDLIKIEKLVAKYKSLHPKTKLEIIKFTEPVRLSEQIRRRDLADIYILDIIMSQTTGIEIGNQIRDIAHQKPVIIYITSSNDFALEAYDIHAIRYLLKPVQEDKFFEALDYALSCRELKKDPVFPVKTREGLVSIPCSQIEYIENTSRTLEVHLTNQEQIKSIFIRRSFEDEIQPLTDSRNFVQVHKSFLINFQHVKKLDTDSIFMNSGASIPVSKRNTARVKKEYLLFVSEQYTL